VTRQQERIHVIFIHGLFSDATVWADFQQLIQNDPELAGFVTTECFSYDSPWIRLRPDRRIADIDDIADQLGTYLTNGGWDADAIVLVTHSQGGLVAQRFLVRTLQRHEGLRLSNIRQIVMYACPNRGSEFFLLSRRFAWFLRNPQERQLRPFDKVLAETELAITRSVLNSTDNTTTECHVPIAAYGGTADKIVPPHVARGIFPINGVVSGDHFSVVRPTDPKADSYRVLKNALVAVSSEQARTHETRATVDDRSKPVIVTPPYNKRTKSIHGRGRLIATLTSDRRNRVHVIAGLGGYGKSRLALEVAHREKSRRRVWWILPPRINSGMREVAIQLGASANDVDQAWANTRSAADLVWKLLNASTSQWLLVIDNADEPDLLSLPGSVVSDGDGWLRNPTTSDGMVIVTSRDRSRATWGNWCRLHAIKPLDDEQGAWVVMDRAGPGAGSNEQARALSAQLGGLPLALASAGDYLHSVVNTKVFPGSEAIRDFESFRLAVKRWFESPAGARDTDDDDFEWLQTVRSVAHISLDLLATRGFGEAAPLLKLFACLAIAPIPYHVLLSSDALHESPLFAEFTAARRHSVLEALDGLGLVDSFRQPHVSGELAHVLTLHPVVHGILRKDEDVQLQRNDYYGLNVRMMLDATAKADPDEPANWFLWNGIAPHAAELCRSGLLGNTLLDDNSVIESCLELARLTTRYLIAVALLAPADQLLQELIGGCGRFGFATTDRALLGLRHEQGRIEIERGNPAAAERELAEVIVHRTAILRENHYDTLASRHKHARAILDQGRWQEAEDLLRAVVAAEHDVRGTEHKDTLVVRHSLARAVLALGRAGEAETMLREILDVYERRSTALASASSEASRVRSTLGRALIQQERYAEAEEAMRTAIQQTSDSHDTSGAFWIRWVLAEALLLQGEVPESISELAGLENDQRRVLGATHPDTRRTTESLIKARTITNG
jgi:pimeloyl-ACP methyl ester carboxylesterase/tetratricopeptide (TPR) repeat protein